MRERPKTVVWVEYYGKAYLGRDGTWQDAWVFCRQPANGLPVRTSQVVYPNPRDAETMARLHIASAQSGVAEMYYDETKSRDRSQVRPLAPGTHRAIPYEQMREMASYAV